LELIMSQQQNDQMAEAKMRRTGLVLLLLPLAMLGLSYAAVPLYDLFCRVTGYGGTTQIAEQLSDQVMDREVTVRFDANTSRGLDWTFRPAEARVSLKVGENRLVFYEATNRSDRPLSGTATFNVTPEEVGIYFNKVECFCFIKQTLEPGQRVDMPVSFFIDPAILDDPIAGSIADITLSYTFFPTGSETGEPDTGPRASARPEADDEPA
jgi:cytochrome c oxidase assembly protein subunit 11